MASTTLFAPQVRAVQPAFVYDLKYKITTDTMVQTSKKYFLLINNSYVLQKNLTSFDSTKIYYELDSSQSSTSVRIYFNLSSYNTINDVKYILYTIIDPNKASTWGTNSVIEANAAPVGYLCEPFNVNNKDNQSGEYYIEINLSNGIKFKELTKNQFYQVQLYFCDITTSITGTIDQEWLNSNKDNISVASQATLVRPIPELKNGFPVFDFPSTGSMYDLPLLKGRIEYEDDSKIETIDTCWVEVYKNNGSTRTKVYTSPQKIKNQLGLSFEIPIDNYVFTNGTYNIKLYYITKHGYERKPTNYETQIFTIKLPTFITDSGFVENHSNYFKITIDDLGILQRQELSQNKWETIGNINSDYYDYNIEALNKYVYRILGSENKRSSQEDSLFDDIFLSDADTMLAVRYNPNISGLKYVTQEAIINTLSGKYPVIRKNGDTRYRQFNLSGTLYMNASEYSVSKPSTSVSTQNWNVFFNHLGEKPSLYIKNKARLKSYYIKDRLERQAREIAIDFLTNNSIKLFRSPTEGNMIVYLSGVSFTPNKQLGRNVYDFSCTVTEVCEYNMENIKKYNLNDGRQFQEATKTTTVPSGDPVTVREV